MKLEYEDWQCNSVGNWVKYVKGGRPDIDFVILMCNIANQVQTWELIFFWSYIITW
jgi:hypothetical protein